MPRYINNSNRSYCIFCGKNVRIEGMTSGFFCPNGHFEVKANGQTEEKQPVSTGTNMIGKRVYRNSEGYLCNKEGVKLKKSKKIYLR